ncbi:MAG TPA: MmgE/PrpD family protein [Marmoricola sp.]|nr:MmgE/PrpD family protein [Marmoricola sp.]
MIVHEFAEFAVAHRDQPLSPEVLHGANRALVDWYGATVAGSATPAGKRIRAGLAFSTGHGSATLVPEGVPADPRTAALINGTASHVVEMDDIFRDGIYHPGSPTVAAALATAQHLGASGEALLRAIAIGYEISCRIAAAIQPAHYRYWHTTGTVGTIGAAAATAELLGLDADRFAHALANATTTAAGLQQAFRSDAMGKPLHAGHAADAGMVAAFAAREDFTGAWDILEGPAGFGAAMSEGPDWKSAVAALGTTWAVTQQTVKNHSCCGHTFAAVDAALELRARGVEADQIAHVEVETYGTALAVAGNTDPVTDFEAKFSLAYTVAAAFAVGSVRLASFTPRWLTDPGLRDLVARTTATVSPEFDALFPQQRAARVRVTMKDGSVVETTRHTRHGDPDDPLTDEELSEKFAELVASVLGDAAAADLARALWAVDGVDDVNLMFQGQRTDR